MIKCNDFREKWNAVTARLLQRKPAEKSIEQIEASKDLLWYHLLAYGVAATVGSGIYVVVGEIAKSQAGPAVIFCVLGSGILSLLTAFCYLELAAMVPTTGSSYVYGYTFMGELMGFLLGWVATLEYAFAASVTAVSWTSYFVSFFKATRTDIPSALYSIPADDTDLLFHVNLIAFLMVFVTTFVVLRGVSFGAKLNTMLTVFNLSIILFIIIMGSTAVDTANWTDFFPYNTTSLFRGAAIMIYSYIGFDTICNLSSDAKSIRHLQVAVIGTVTLATALYVAVGLVLTGMVFYTEIDPGTCLASAFVQTNLSWVGYVVRCCSMSMLIATLLACLIGQPRLFEVMAMDGFLPKIFYKKNAKGIPTWNIIICCTLSAVIALFIKVDDLFDLVSLGALFGFTLNACGLIISRLRLDPKVQPFGLFYLAWLFIGCFITWPFMQQSKTVVFLALVGPMILLPFGLLCYLFYKNQETLKRAPLPTASGRSLSRSLCPWMPLIPCLVIIGNSAVIPTLPTRTYIQFVIWLVIGILIYAFYGYRNSRLHLSSKECEFESTSIKEKLDDSPYKSIDKKIPI